MSKCNGYVPLNGNTYQVPRTGSVYILAGWYNYGSNRQYMKNRMKSNLQSGKTYCVKFYVNIANTSPRGMDGFGIYFGDNTIDTIKYNTVPLTYLTPQVKNPLGNVIKDTLNWVAVTGTFVATGNEKYALMGNFLADNAVTTASIGGMYFPAYWTDLCIDDVSCIELNLPAFAGRDTSVAPVSPVFLGRQPDVGIDEACVWYKLPNTTPIDTVAGFWVQPTATSTYVVEQTICGLIKRDTVVIHMNLLGNNELGFGSAQPDIRVWPNPVEDVLAITTQGHRGSETQSFIYEVRIINSLGQKISEKEIEFKNNKIEINTSELPNGVYYLRLKSGKANTVSKRFVISR